MSAIGDYIHYTIEGYYGNTGTTRPPVYATFDGDLVDRQNKINKWISAEKKTTTADLKLIKKELDKRLKIIQRLSQSDSLFNNPTEAESIDLQWFEQIVDQLQQQLPQLVGTINIEEVIKKGGLSGKSYEIPDSQYEKYVQKNIQELVTKITNVCNSINQKNSPVSQKELQGYLKTLDTNQSQFLASIKSVGYKNTKGNLDGIINSYFEQILTFFQSDKEGKQEIQSVLSNFLYAIEKRNLSNNIQGALGEILVDNIRQELAYLIPKTLRESLFGRGIIGEQSSVRVVEGELLSSTMQTLMSQNYKLKDGIMITAQSAQEKVDVELKLSPTLDNSQGIFASVKNYGSSKLSFKASPVIQLLQNENGNNIVNHFLNLHSIQTKNKKYIESRNQVDNYLRQVLIAKLVTGYNTITTNSNNLMKTANVFIVIDPKKYTAQVYQMSDLLTNDVLFGTRSALGQNKHDKLLPNIPVINRRKYMANGEAERKAQQQKRIECILRPLYTSGAEFTVTKHQLGQGIE